ncbi:PREDICTED: solute carrier family 22 member 24-like [Priapulus caudatus]|uniref:Solute carrier family 22 member 24-like n=1 Tax=Priapulus caudatus TaxID=37621 RepID=A0ABM1F2C3_PRICU|nr:PREDICTED: solute carrier family 22 member 24-like [Priapulus caudatus]
MTTDDDRPRVDADAEKPRDPRANGGSSTPLRLEPEAVDFERALEAVGGMGRWQHWRIVVVFLVGVPSGFHNVAISFLAASPDHWCAVPTLQGALLPLELQRHYSVPTEMRAGRERYSQCYKYAHRDYDLIAGLYANGSLPPPSFYDNASAFYDNASALAPSSLLPPSFYDNSSAFYDNTSALAPSTLLLPATFYDNASAVPCDAAGWVYDQPEGAWTAVTQWDLVCDKAWLVATAQMLFMAGHLTGCIVFGSISDKIGRRKTLLISLTLMVVTTNATAFAPSYAIFGILRLFRHNFVRGIHDGLRLPDVDTHGYTDMLLLIEVIAWISCSSFLPAGFTKRN